MRKCMEHANRINKSESVLALQTAWNLVNKDTDVKASKDMYLWLAGIKDKQKEKLIIKNGV